MELSPKSNSIHLQILLFFFFSLPIFYPVCHLPALKEERSRSPHPDPPLLFIPQLAAAAAAAPPIIHFHLTLPHQSRMQFRFYTFCIRWRYLVGVVGCHTPSSSRRGVVVLGKRISVRLHLPTQTTSPCPSPPSYAPLFRKPRLLSVTT